MPRNARFPLLAVGSAVLVALVLVLALSLSDDAEDDGGGAVATAPANVRTATQPPAETTPDDAGGERATSAKPSLAAGDTELLPAPDGGLAALDGERVAGQRLVVVRASDSSFFVGRRAGDPDAVEVRESSSYAPQRGDSVNLAGVLRDGVVEADSVVPQGTGGASGDSDSTSGSG